MMEIRLTVGIREIRLRVGITDEGRSSFFLDDVHDESECVWATNFRAFAALNAFTSSEEKRQGDPECEQIILIANDSKLQKQRGCDSTRALSTRPAFEQ